jgi:hypothetical protein
MVQVEKLEELTIAVLKHKHGKYKQASNSIFYFPASSKIEHAS